MRNLNALLAVAFVALMTGTRMGALMTSTRMRAHMTGTRDRLRDDAPDSIQADWWPWLWRSFDAAGYRTMLADDGGRESTLAQLKLTFTHPPTQHFSTFSHVDSSKHPSPLELLDIPGAAGNETEPSEEEEEEGVGKEKWTPECYGRRMRHGLLMEYMHELFRLYANQPLFVAALFTHLTQNAPAERV